MDVRSIIKRKFDSCGAKIPMGINKIIEKIRIAQNIAPRERRRVVLSFSPARNLTTALPNCNVRTGTIRPGVTFICVQIP